VSAPAAASCVFCRIASGDAPAVLLHEDAHSLAFMDIAPVVDGHVLVVTRAHYENLYEAEPEALAAVSRSARRLALAIRAALEPDGLMVTQLNGAAAGQTVFHYHQHLIPRRLGDGLRLHGRSPASPEALRRTGERLRAHLR